MTVRRLINNDYSFGGGQADLIDGIDACLQQCKTTLMQLKGEWFLDYRDGIAWGDILGHKPDSEALSSLVKNSLLKVDGVNKVTTITIERDDRYAYVIATIETDFGKANFNQSFNIMELIANEQVNK